MKGSPKHTPFSKLMKRDNLYERLRGMPTKTKEEMVKEKKKNEAYVSANHFLPNSLVNSPKFTAHSNTMKTRQMGLFNMD